MRLKTTSPFLGSGDYTKLVSGEIRQKWELLPPPSSWIFLDDAFLGQVAWWRECLRRGELKPSWKDKELSSLGAHNPLPPPDVSSHLQSWPHTISYITERIMSLRHHLLLALQLPVSSTGHGVSPIDCESLWGCCWAHGWGAESTPAVLLPHWGPTVAGWGPPPWSWMKL